MDGKILVTGSSVEERLLAPLNAAGLRVVNPTQLLTEKELKIALSDASGYLLGGDEVATEAALADANALKVIAFLGVGYESFIDVSAATTRGIAITNTPGTLIDSVAEFTIGHLLNLRRQLAHYANLYRNGKRGTEEKQFDLRNHEFGIVGLGAIGTRIAEILRLGFGAQVAYYSRTRKPDVESKLGIHYEELTTLVSHIDGLVVMTPGNDSTKNMIDTTILSAAKPGLLLINTARPEIVTAEALRFALVSGRLGAAAFDGFYEDEIGDALLRDFGDDRLIVTGHIGSLTHDARDAMAMRAVSSILNVLNTGNDPYVVNA